MTKRKTNQTFNITCAQLYLFWHVCSQSYRKTNRRLQQIVENIRRRHEKGNTVKYIMIDVLRNRNNRKRKDRLKIPRGIHKSKINFYA